MNFLITRTKPISQLLKPTSRTLFISLFSTSSPSSSPRYIPHEKPISEEKQSKSSNAMNLAAKTDTIQSKASLGQDFSPERLTSNVVLEKSISEENRSKSRDALNLVAKTNTVGNSDASLGFISKIVNCCKTWMNETGFDKPNEFQSPTIEPSPVEEDARKFDEVTSSKKPVSEEKQSKSSNSTTLVPKTDTIEKPKASLGRDFTPNEFQSPAIEPSPVKEDARKSDKVPPSTRKHDLFRKDSFWSALRSFFKTNRGSEIVFNALSREQIADKLRKEGILFLRPLQSIDIYHLVDLLITEKKWIKELPTKNPRFKLVSLYEESSTPTQPHNPTRLSSIFLNPQSPDNSQLRVSSIAPAPKELSEKSRTEILADCQKLLDEILSQNPDGFSMRIFKKKFLKKYGYALDHQKLGYPKLASLLQVKPGVKVKAARVFLDNVVYSPEVKSLGLKKSTRLDSELSDSARKDDEVEDEFSELGPVVKSDLTLNGSNGEYESAMSVEDVFSDSEKEERSCSSNPVKVEEQSNSKVGEDDNSLLQILNSRYSTPSARATRETISRILTANPTLAKMKSARQDH